MLRLKAVSLAQEQSANLVLWPHLASINDVHYQIALFLAEETEGVISILLVGLQTLPVSCWCRKNISSNANRIV
jgi:hypothetical protein